MATATATTKSNWGDTLYHYDPLNQLKKVQYPSYTEELFYDKAGNRARRIARGVEELYQYDPRNRLTAYTKNGVTTPFQYDNAGNLLVDDKARYSYDAFNRTTKVETFDGNVQVNRYDAEGLRYEMEENGRLVQFIFHKGEAVAEQEENSNVIRLIRGSELIARSSDSESARTYYHYASDEMGSTTHIVDEQGKVQNRYEYDAWGNITAQEEAVPNRFKYTSQQLDPITQQYYLRARFYNPVIARFTQEDTYRGDGLNLYAYCANNPTYYTDPSGHQPNCVKDAAARYMAEGMSTEDAYRRAYAEHAQRKLDDPNLSPREKYELQQRQRRINPGDVPQADIPTASGSFKKYVQREQEIQRDLAAQRNKWNIYLDDVETQTGRKIPIGQREMVIYEGIHNSVEHQRLSRQDYQNHSKDFQDARARLRQEWELATGQILPQMATGQYYDAHELIPKVYNSPLQWWNIHPALKPDQHQRGIHRKNAPLYSIYPRK